ncbi:MAG: hypothetical protein KDD99_03100 [Bacteroidetes bacterium]|nr:hypothetical protein [Bacteroidota bacterium]
MKNYLFLAAMICFSAFSNLKAQSMTDEIEIKNFTRDFIIAYNQQDDAALKNMYMVDAEHIDANGKEIRGADQIAAAFLNQFINQNTTLLLKPSHINWSDSQHAFVVSGTYEIYGKTIVYDIDIDEKGGFSFAMIQKDGTWKIGKSVFFPTIKIMIHHKVKDFSEWKSVFDENEPKRQAAGELRSEVGTLHSDPQTAYIIGEWTSLESFQAFFENPDLGKTMQAAGVIGKPVVMILDRK